MNQTDLEKQLDTILKPIQTTTAEFKKIQLLNLINDEKVKELEHLLSQPQVYRGAITDRIKELSKREESK